MLKMSIVLKQSLPTRTGLVNGNTPHQDLTLEMVMKLLSKPNLNKSDLLVLLKVKLRTNVEDIQWDHSRDGQSYKLISQGVLTKKLMLQNQSQVN